MKRETLLHSFLLLSVAWLPPVLAQSEASQVSALSVAPSVEAAAIVLASVPTGSELVVQALRPLGASVQVVLVSVAGGASVVIELGADVVQRLALVAGGTLVLTAVSAGYVLSVGAEVVAFVPDALTRTLIHHRELHR